MTYFLADHSPNTRFREQCYTAEAISSHQIILGTGLISTSYFVTEEDKKKDPVELIMRIQDNGYAALKRTSEPYTFHDLYHRGMYSKWPYNSAQLDMQYTPYEVHVDFSKRGHDQVEKITIDNQPIIDPVVCTFAELHNMIYTKPKKNRLHDRTLRSLRHVDGLIQQKYPNTIQHVLDNCTSNQAINNAGQRLSWAEGYYLRKGAEKAAIECNFPLLVTVFDDNKNSTLMTITQARSIRHHGRTSIPITDKVNRAGALLNNLVFEAWIAAGKPVYTDTGKLKPLYSEEQFVGAGEWLTEVESVEFFKKPRAGGQDFRNALTG